MNEEQILSERMEAQPALMHHAIPEDLAVPCPPQSCGPPVYVLGDSCQWSVLPNGGYRATSRTVPTLPAGVYRPDCDNIGPFVTRQVINCDSIVELPDTSMGRVLGSIRKFWQSEDLYRQHGLLYKRGILLWGPPGAGKTILVQVLVRELISMGGIVVLFEKPALAVDILTSLRVIEPRRPLIVIIEDIDELISRTNERDILAFLDGEKQIKNVVSIATTNYPERLGARIVNRPSRFDERIMIGMPSEAARMAYLQKATSNGSLPVPAELHKWCMETEGLSIAHLRELVAAVHCLGQPYSDVLARLKAMGKRPKDVEGFSRAEIGWW